MTAKEFEVNYLGYLNEIGQVVKPEFDSTIQYLTKVRLNEIIHPEKQFLSDYDARGFVWNMFLIANNIFKYVSKEYLLLSKNIDLVTLTEIATQICIDNPDITVSEVYAIPEEYIASYVELSLEGERNTRGLLEKGEISKFNAAYIRNDYNNRGTNDRLCFDVLLIDNATNNIIGKLNSYGNIHGGPCLIYHMYVREDFRNRGLGKLLLLKTILHASEILPKLSSCLLQTHESNLSAQRIIKQIGFVENEMKNRHTITTAINEAEF